MRRRAKGGLAVGGLAVAIAGAGTAMASLPTTSGNAPAIAFERAAVIADDHSPGYQWSATGLMAVYSVPSKGDVPFELRWDGVVPKGWSPVTQHGEVALHADGQVSWLIDDLYPTAPSTPIQTVVSSQGAFWRPLATSKPACFDRWNGSLPWTGSGLPGGTGTWFVLYGDYAAPPQRHGADTDVTYTYGNSSETATETDTFVTATKAIVKSTVRVVGKKGGEPAFSFETDWTQLTRSPGTLKPITLCTV